MSNPLKDSEDEAAAALLAEGIAKRPPTTLPGTPDLEAEKRARLAETERDNARVLAERKHYGG